MRPESIQLYFCEAQSNKEYHANLVPNEKAGKSTKARSAEKGQGLHRS